LILRAATRDDVALLDYWDTKPHVKWCTGFDPDAPLDPEDQEDWAHEITRPEDWIEILIGEADGRPIGVIQIIDPAREATHYWGKCAPDQRAIDIWIGEESDLGRGYGTPMMQQAIARCFSDPAVINILIDPLQKNVAAIRFYRRLGFVDVGPRRFGDDECLVMELRRAQWEETKS
jgi:aminoglycoside 6'-N-acetyltransferase